MTKPTTPKAECDRHVCPECGRLYAAHGPPCVAADDKSAGEARVFTWYNCERMHTVCAGIRYDGQCPQCKEVVHLVESEAYLRMKSERDELRKAISQDYISNFHHEKHVDQIRKERDAARAEVEMHKQTIQLCNESMRVDAADVATLNDENERLKATEKVYNMNRDWIDKAKIRIATLEAEDNRNVARIHRQSSIMADVEKENARLREALLKCLGKFNAAIDNPDAWLAKCSLGAQMARDALKGETK